MNWRPVERTNYQVRPRPIWYRDEAAHALADVRNIKDTSRQGRWHNTRFKGLAEELGVQVTQDPRLGWSPTTVTDATRTTYRAVVDQLRDALRRHRSHELAPGAGKTKKPTPPSCACDCGRKIRVSPTVLALGPITCGVCGSEFALDGAVIELGT